MSVETSDCALPHSITLSLRACGPRDAPVLLFLHGFPEGAFVWDNVMQALSKDYRCIAPDLRGFGASSAPEGVDAYHARHLVGDIVALIDGLGAAVEMLIAHDWGGAVAWGLAATQPQRLRRLMVLNSPHPATFLRELRDNPRQQAASAYMNFLCRVDAASLLAADDFQRLWPFFTGVGDAAWLDDALRERYRTQWRHGLEGGLNYYRASPLRPPAPGGRSLVGLELPPQTLHVTVPTTVLWGEQDVALLPGLLDGLDAYVPDLTLRRVADASHWIVHEKPQLVVATIREALAR